MITNLLVIKIIIIISCKTNIVVFTTRTGVYNVPGFDKVIPVEVTHELDR